MQRLAGVHLALLKLQDSLNAEMAHPRNKTAEGQQRLQEQLRTQVTRLMAAAGMTNDEFQRRRFEVSTDSTSRQLFDDEIARLTGVPTDAVRLAAFCITGALSGVAGIVGLAFLLYVQGTSGTGLELLVITAVIVGGTALFGGSGTILGTVAGVALIGVLQNVLILGGVSSFVQTIVVGAVIIIAVALDTWLRRRRRT